jgi:hypothetical protein
LGGRLGINRCPGERLDGVENRSPQIFPILTEPVIVLYNRDIQFLVDLRGAIAMKKIVLIATAGLMTFLATGCSTPAYSGKERFNMITRNIDMEFKMLQDDIDHALLLRPVSSMSKWHVTPN